AVVRLRLGPGEGLLPGIQRYRGEQGLVAGADGAGLVDQHLGFAVDHAVRAQAPFDQGHRMRRAAFQGEHAADRTFEVGYRHRRARQARAGVAAGDVGAVEDQPGVLLLDGEKQAHGATPAGRGAASVAPVRNRIAPRNVSCSGAGARSLTTGASNRPSSGWVTDSSNASAPNMRSPLRVTAPSTAAMSSRPIWLWRRLIRRSPQASGCRPLAWTMPSSSREEPA